MSPARREALNRALHELRRPLQALALAADGWPDAERDCVELALVALADLDREVNGGSRLPARCPISCRAIVERAAERWRGPAARAGRILEVRWRAGRAQVLADHRRLDQALDNLISNALEHGGLRVQLNSTLRPGAVRIAVWDSGGAAPRRPGLADPRRGHGLEVAGMVAAEHGGSLFFRRLRSGTLAALELPLAPLSAVSGASGLPPPRSTAAALPAARAA